MTPGKRVEFQRTKLLLAIPIGNWHALQASSLFAAALNINVKLQPIGDEFQVVFS